MVLDEGSSDAGTIETGVPKLEEWLDQTVKSAAWKEKNNKLLAMGPRWMTILLSSLERAQRQFMQLFTRAAR